MADQVQIQPRDGSRERPLRVAHLTTVDMSLELLLGTELSEGVERGWHVFGISASGPWVEHIEARGVRHVPIASLTRSWSPRDDLRAARELAQVMRDLDLDVLHTHNPKTGVLGRIIGRLVRVPVVVNTCHGLWARHDDRLVKKILVYGAEAFAAQFSHAELYQNAEDARTLRWAVPARKVRVVGNGVDLERFSPDPEGGAKVRAELGVADDELLVGGVGRRVAEKGIREFSVAARALADRARFVWVGPDDPDKPDALFDVERRIGMLGLRNDMPAIYSALDVFVLPSYREGFSRSAMEAAACGCAMVLTDIRGCREIGGHGTQLVLAPARDATGLTNAVDRLLRDKELRINIGHAARARALQAFDQREVARLSWMTYGSVASSTRLDDGTEHVVNLMSNKCRPPQCLSDERSPTINSYDKPP